MGSISYVIQPVTLSAAQPQFATDNPQPTSRNLGLDGLRGIAVLAVMTYHFWPSFLPGGFLGVDLFFTLSGFLITGGLLRSMEGRRFPDLRGFWLRRARRLVPAMILVLVLCTALALLAVGQLPAGLRWQWAGALTYTSNWMQIAHGNSYFSSVEPLYFQHFWSLAVEEQFYVLWPLVLVLLAGVLRKRGALMCGILVVAAASAASMAWGFDASTDSSVLYFGTWTHGFGLLLGSSGAVACANGQVVRRGGSQRSRMLIQLLQILILGCLLVAFAVLPDTSVAAYQGGMALFCVAATVLMMTLRNSGTWGYTLLSHKYLRWLGQRSYGLYLWHWPLLVLAQTIFPPQAQTAAVLCVIPLIFLAAQLSWQFVEQPILQYGFILTLSGWAKNIAGRILQVWNGATSSFGAVAMLLALVLVPLCATSVLMASPAQSQLEQQLTLAQNALEEESKAPVVEEHQPLTTDDAQRDNSTKKPSKNETARKKFTGQDVTALGDSVMLASSPQMLKKLPGISIHASVGAQIWDAPARLSELKSAGELRKVVVVGLGTNGDIPAGTLEQIRSVIGAKRELLLITTFAPRQWISHVNDSLRAAAESDSKTHLIDWAHTAPTVDDMARDDIHPGPHGGAAYGQLLADAVRNL
ncbi:Peptidoglycan/LPS O-acetylase OafA/YrhL, contains acyltransferase and SGNH-hydrolase domains [Arthrobacter sp. NIO-1057]|nr:Peptidoglycan/LPS O-acetylase OafA/YrhL, contains acyltransferase and SGNH-hydrolase domains [Arthrobacter sp. NIO-1057]